MTTSRCDRRRRHAGFSLVEVLVSMGLSSIVLAGILSTFILLVRSGTRLENYSVMETQSRRAFEQMGIDARMANAFTANFTNGKLTSFTLTIPSENLSSLTQVTYGFRSTPDGFTFFSVPGSNPTSETNRRDLITHIESISILRYDSNYNLMTSTTSSAGIRHVQISVNIKRKAKTLVDATQVIRSTAFTIRNISI